MILREKIEGPKDTQDQQEVVESSGALTELLSLVDGQIKSLSMDIVTMTKMLADINHHVVRFTAMCDDRNEDWKSLILIKYMISCGQKYDSNIGLWCIKHYKESGITSKYPQSTCENAAIWLKVMKYDPDKYFGPEDMGNEEAVSFFKKKGLKF